MDLQNTLRDDKSPGLDDESLVSNLEQVIESIPQPLLIIKEGRFIHCNTAALRFFGFSQRDHLVGRSLSSLSPRQQPDGKLSEDLISSGIRNAIEGIPWSGEWVWTRSDGTLLFSDFTLTRLRKTDTLLLASITDLSEKQKLLDEIDQLKLEINNKITWYEAMVDSIKHPVIVTDMNRLITFGNKAIENLLRVKRKDIIGRPCSEGAVGICTYENSGTNQLPAGFFGKDSALSGGKFTIDTVPLIDSTGSMVGFVYEVMEETAMARLTEYLNHEISHLARNLSKLADGDLNLDYQISEPDEYTREAASLFQQINSDLKKATDAINMMMEDVMTLSESAVNGVLETRADVSRHKGDYTLVIQGINETLDAIFGPVEEAIRVCNVYSRGNFSETFNPVIMVSGEFLQFRDSLNTIGSAISKMIGNLKDQMQSLDHHANNAATGVEDVSRGAKEIAARAEETSANAEKAENGIDQVLQGMSDLTTVVSDISANADIVARLSEDANAQAKEGTKFAGSAENGMKSITDSSSEVERIITEIREEMNKIRKIVNIITDLANQTNLLALNAAIEAARAGDAGRGFAVVAAEVKSLAQESRISAESIADMIQGLERKSDNAALAIEASGKAVQEGNRSLSDTLAVFHELTGSVDMINEKMLIIARSTQQQAATFQEITASAQEMSTLVKKTADDATQSSATSIEALAIVDQITAVIGLINEAVAAMDKEIEEFIIQK